MDSQERVERTFGFVDVAGFTALTEAHGDEAAAELIRDLSDLVEGSLRKDVALLEIVGDAALLVAPSPQPMIETVVELFREALARPDFPVLRAGLHHGEILRQGERYVGATLNLTARVAARAQGGQCVATRSVAETARSLGIAAESVGFVSLRNVHDPVELFVVRVTASDVAPVIDPVCRMQVERGRAAGTLRFGAREYWFCSLECAARFAASPESYSSP